MEMMGLILSIVPYWESSSDITKFSLYGWGNSVYWARQILYLDIDERKGEGWATWSARGLYWGAGAELRRNEWGISVDFEQVSLKYWKDGETGRAIYDNSSRVWVDLSGKRYKDELSNSSVGAFIRYSRMTSQTVATTETYYACTTALRSTVFGVRGRLFIENPDFNEPDRGFLPWLGAYAGFMSSSYSDEFGMASEASSFNVGVEMGLKWKPLSWLDFWAQGVIDLWELGFDVEGVQLEYPADFLRYNSTFAQLRAGLTLTYTRGYVLQ